MQPVQRRDTQVILKVHLYPHTKFCHCSPYRTLDNCFLVISQSEQIYKWSGIYKGPVTTKGTFCPCFLKVTGLVLILFTHELASVFSRQKVQYNRMKAMIQLILIMLCTDKAQINDQWYKHSNVLNGLSNGMVVLHGSTLLSRNDWTRVLFKYFSLIGL